MSVNGSTLLDTHIAEIATYQLCIIQVCSPKYHVWLKITKKLTIKLPHCIYFPYLFFSHSKQIIFPFDSSNPHLP